MPGTSGMGTELRGASGRKGITCGVAVAFCARTRPKYPAVAIIMATAVVIRKIHNSLADGAFIYFSPSAHRTKLIMLDQSRKLCALPGVFSCIARKLPTLRHQQDRRSSL